MRLVLGGYTSGAGGGLGVVTLQDGRFGTPVVVAEATNPSFLVVSPERRFVCAVIAHELDGETGWLCEGKIGPRSRTVSSSLSPCASRGTRL